MRTLSIRRKRLKRRNLKGKKRAKLSIPNLRKKSLFRRERAQSKLKQKAPQK